MEKRWTILQAEHSKVQVLTECLKINPVICQILAQRGIEGFETAKAFFRPQLAYLHDPWLMKDMDKAVDRLINSFKRKEKILVFGDYDVDGTTSVACMYHFLRSIYDPSLIDFYIPHRYREGYGISQAGIDFAKDQHFNLIISLDCGIKSAHLIAQARDAGIDFIVCDHHLPDLDLPPAVAILNPKQLGCSYPYKELCGCGVGFKLMTALSQRLSLEPSLVFTYLDLVATAIAADIVPITGENRILAYFGLKKVNENPNNGIKALIQLNKLETELQISSLIYMIAPRINAAGRMDDARKAVELFLSPSVSEALHFAKMLHSDNSDRKEADANITEEAVDMIESNPQLLNRKTTVVYQPHWHKGVVGIVASRLIEKYYRPTVVLTRSGEVVAGSARSVSGFNLYEAVHSCREYLLGYGGHFAAAGMTMLPEQVEAFSSKFEEVVALTIDPTSMVPEIRVDAIIHFKDILPSFYNILKQMEPFGPENDRPVFLAQHVVDTGYSRIVKDQHLRFSLRQENTVITGIGFNMAAKFNLLSTQKPLDIIFTLDENHWNGQTTLQLKIIDFRFSTDHKYSNL